MKKTSVTPEKSISNQAVLRDTPKGLPVKTRIRAGLKISDVK